jgi:predicted RNA-binding protein with PIN domain
MSRWFLIIDGYNLMHAWGLARQRYGPGDLERLRERFLQELANRLTDEERSRTMIVFDAGAEAPTDIPTESVFRTMQIVFARRQADADAKIEQLVKAHSTPRQLRVVSGDRRLQTAARRRRGQFVTSEQFVLELERSQAPLTSPPSSRELETKSTGQLTDAEIAEWLKLFGESHDADSPAGPPSG